MKRRLSIKPDLDSKEEEEKKNFALLHAKVKVKVKEEAAISDDVVQSRLALIGYETYDIKVEPPEILDATTTRDFTSTTWGGNRIWTFPRIQQKFVNIHGLNDFMFCNLEYNPAVPRWPGAPGLYFESWRSFQDWPRIQRVLVRLRDNAWHYVGQYQLTPAPALTGEEWRCQTDIVKNTWAQNLSFRMYGRHVRASIVLRKRFGREASEDELSTAMESNGKFDVPAHEILQAYDRGEMHLQVWCMKCVGYDEDFQRKIAAGNQAPARRVRG
ncbi:hypothetical protein BV22DRAFT_241127 [Leucogyrophana mollusca]|uniref:Uncharacterized protein n=1 Tax=Leucogyrophana mollusca TaxID=85980 RepID=A0ACB8BPR7_9AGAM|nr:hypothetical protein BV22DRAFT_241127 [Leucogyrophana mollusca]